MKITLLDAVKGIYRWTNRAKVSWTLTVKSGSSNTLTVGKTCPYWKSGHKEATLIFGAGGEVVAIKGPHGEVYRKSGSGKGSGSGSGGKKGDGDSDKSTDDNSGDDSSGDDSKSGDDGKS